MLTNDEIITELEYLMERGVPQSVEIVFLTLCGTLKTNVEILNRYASLNQVIAKQLRDFIVANSDQSQ